MPDVTDESLLADGVRCRRNVLIPLSDGVELAASLYLPPSGERHPTLVSYYPYRKDDVIGSKYEHAHIRFARLGYAGLLVDFRGTGGSAGTCTPTFDLRAEGRDGAEVVEWAALQEWCDGNIGLWGMSYGGCMSLAIGANRPASLKAIAPMFASADLYHDFVYPGGCPNLIGNAVRESLMLALDLAPPTYQDSAGRWARVWRERLNRFERGPVYSLDWPDHPDFDEHWQRSTVDVERIAVPALFVAGWNDVLLRGVTDSFERVRTPKRMIIGPWTHVLPDTSAYEPWDWIAELAAWFDRWLRGADEVVSPDVLAFVQGDQSWRAVETWPPAVAPTSLYLADGNRLLAQPPGVGGADSHRGDPRTGSHSGLLDPVGLGVGYPRDQNADDRRSLCYGSTPLEHDIEIAGTVETRIFVELVTGGELYLTAKLSYVAPDGGSTLMATGCLNAAHRDSSSQARRLRPGDVEELTVELQPTAWRVPAGHSLRLAISTADFPRIWPTPERPEIRVHFGPDHPSAITVPTTPAGTEVGTRVAVTRPDPGLVRHGWTVDANPRHVVREDLVTGESSVTIGSESRLVPPHGGELSLAFQGTATTGPDTVGARFTGSSHVRVQMDGGEQVDVETRSSLSRDRTLLNAKVTIDGRTLLDRLWTNF